MTTPLLHEHLPQRAGMKRSTTRPRRAVMLVVGSAIQAGLGVVWARGGGGYPFAFDGGGLQVSVLADLDPSVVGLSLVVVAGLAAATAVLTLARVRLPTPVEALVHATGWVAIAGLVLVVPDYRLLGSVGYTPIVLLGSPFGWPDGVTLAQVWPWDVTYLGLTTLWGLVWAATLVGGGRGTQPTPPDVSHAPATGWRSPAAAARWGRWAVAVAVAIPLMYAITRWAWALGIPLGISSEVLAEHASSGLWLAGAALGTLAAAGAGLTLGLVQGWGEVTPGWLPLIGGRDVPPAAATVPATIVAVMVTSAGLMFGRLYLADAFDDFFAGASFAVIGPELLWPVWGAALGAATLAYHLRRRGASLAEAA